MSEKKVLVTGAAGFIGSATASMLSDTGYEVIGIDNLAVGNSRNIPKNIEFKQLDIVTDDLSGILKDVTACVHFAGLIQSNKSMKHPIEYFRNNVVGSLNLISQLETAQIQKLVFSSSAAVYQSNGMKKIDETCPTKPSSVYGETKLIIDNSLNVFSNLGKLRSVSLRYFNAAGTYKDNPEGHQPESHLIPLAVDSLSNSSEVLSIFGNDYPTPDGTCIRDYVHVVDLADAHILALDYLENNERLIANLGTGIGHSNLEILTKIEEIAGKPISFKFAERREGDPPYLVADSTLAKEKLNWIPSKNIDDCIADAIRTRRDL